ncbi:MAG: MFS transporter [Acidimicrobiia bacterium]
MKEASTGFGRQTWALTFAIAFVMTGVSLVAPIIPLYAREFGVSYTAAGALITGFALARLMFSLLGGVAGDRYGARRISIGGALLLTVSSVTAALAPSYGALLASRFVEGMGSAILATTASQYLMQTSPKERLGRTMALYQTGLLVGFAIGPFIGGRLAEMGDFRTPFWAYSILGLVVAVLVTVFITDLPPSGKTARESFRATGNMLKMPSFRVILFVAFSLFVMRGGARITLFPLFGSEVVGLSPSQIGDVLSVSAITNLFIVNLGGQLVDRIGRKPVAIWGLILAGLATSAYGFFDSYGSLLVVSGIFGLAAGLASIPPPTMVGDLAPPGAEGSAVGLFRTAGDLGFVVGPLIMGAVADAGNFSAGFIISGVLLAVAALAVTRIPETRHTEVR